MQEILFAARRLLKHPLQLAAGLLAFFLGIGLNTAIYSIGDAIVFKPLELVGLQRLAIFEVFSRGQQLGIFDTSPADFLEYQSRLKSFESLGLEQHWDVTITRDGDPEYVSGARVTANWFELIGSQLLVGRGFRQGEDQSGNHRVAVISHGLWSRRFASEPGIVGRTIRLNREEYEIVGVVKQTSRFPGFMEVFSPIPRTPVWGQMRSDFDYSVVGRLKPGITHAQAEAELTAVQASIISRYKATHEGRSVQVVALNERVAGTNEMAGKYVRMLLVAAGFALLIACANVANLQLARVTGRTREFAIMRAVGAGRWPIARQVLIESLLLSLGGALLGCLGSIWCLDLIKGLLPTELWQFIPMWPYMSVDFHAVLTASLLAVGAGVISGVLAAWQSSRADAQDALREGGRAVSAGSRRQWFRGALVAFQMALAIVLLIGAGLMVRGANASIGIFDSKHPEQVATMQAVLPQLEYPNVEKRLDFSRRLEQGLKNLPGASEVALVNVIPMSDNGSSVSFAVEGRTMPQVADRPRALNLVVTPEYFSLMRIPLRQGRYLSADDRNGRDLVCVVDELLAKAQFPQGNPVGERLTLMLGETSKPCRIVGVVEATMHDAWERSPRPTLYRAFDQNPMLAVSLMVRTNGPVKAMVAAARNAVLAVDPDQPVRQQFSYQELIQTTLGGLRMIALFMGGIGAVAVVLACLGVYSVMSYVVAERTSEIGMRLAMGAQPRDIFKLLGGQALVMSGSGMLGGLIGGYLIAQLFSSMIFGVSSNDFWSLSSGALLLGAVAALATYLPARRALGMDPSTALRHD
ncbi:MAG: ABC transporter permease [Acidobacteria bacterium]|nr:ABC transporter permease [Acidobacteriota bacterium]